MKSRPAFLPRNQLLFFCFYIYLKSALIVMRILGFNEIRSSNIPLFEQAIFNILYIISCIGEAFFLYSEISTLLSP